MSKRSRRSLVSNPITCWSVTHWVSTPRGMQCPQPKKTAGTFRPLERGHTDSASSYRALKGYMHEFVNHTKKEYARGDVHENRAECLFSLLKPYLRVFRGLSKTNLPGYVGLLSIPAELSSAERL